VSSWKFEVSSVRSEGACPQPSGVRLRTSHCPPTAPVAGVVCKTNPIFPRPQTYAGSKTRKTNPISPRRGGACRKSNAQNEPNFAPPEAADGGNCAKRSQTWGDWSIWARAVVTWGAARPRSETCKTNPIPGSQPASRAESCKTNPILGGAGWAEAPGAWADCAKRTQFGPAGG
jgi:hypothetical protein